MVSQINLSPIYILCVCNYVLTWIEKLGIVNFCAVSISLFRLGYHPIGIRLDSGDLAHQSKECRRIMNSVGKPKIDSMIVSSNYSKKNDKFYLHNNITVV